MADNYLFDACALLAFFYREDGFDDLIEASESSLDFWDNSVDDIWNDVKAR